MQTVKRGRHFGRYRQITVIFFKYRLHEILRDFGLDHLLPFSWVPPRFPWQKEAHTKSERTRMALEELGTTFVKMGQILSARTDILPSDFTQELSKLQRSLKPIPLETVEKAIRDELGKPVGELFSSFDPVPVGVASIGQAHGATLHDGTEVVIKVRKPKVVEQVTEDLEILRYLAASAAERREHPQEYDPVLLVEEIADTFNAELDYIREGHSAEHFANFFQEDRSIHIPKVFWEYTTHNVLTLERIKGIGILDIAALDQAGFDRKALAKRAVDIWLKMVFLDNVFHADPHPGNLFVETDGRLGLVDFGMIGIVDDEVRNHLASAAKAILDRDADLLVDALLDLGAIPRSGTREGLLKDLKHMMTHYPLSMEELNLASNLGELLSTVRRNYVQLPANTFLLFKTMAMAQSLGRGLYEEFDFFKAAAPYVQDILTRKYSPSAVFRRLPLAAADFAMLAAGLPRRLLKITRAMERGELQIRTDVSGLERHLKHLERITNRVTLGIIAAALILGLALVFLGIQLGR